MSTPYFDPKFWIELPGGVSHVHRGDLSPCECGATLFLVVEIIREVGKDEKGQPVRERSISIECPTCRIFSAKKQNQRRVIAKMDTRHGLVVDTIRELAGA
jgi:hypothetical protein